MIAVALALVWVGTLAWLAITQANPVTLNRDQVLRAELVVSARIDDIERGACTVEQQWGDDEPLSSIAWSPDGTHVIASSDKHVWVGRVERAAHQLDDVRVISYESAVAAFHPNGRQIAVWGKTLGLWDIVQRQFVWQQQSPYGELDNDVKRPYRLVTWSPNGELVAAVPSASTGLPVSPSFSTTTIGVLAFICLR